jgi:hypothetical protein
VKAVRSSADAAWFSSSAATLDTSSDKADVALSLRERMHHHAERDGNFAATNDRVLVYRSSSGSA